MHLDVELTLGRNLVEAATTGITLHVYDAKTVAHVLADALERGQQARLNLCLQVLCLLFQFLLLGAGLFHDLVQLAALHFEVGLLLFQQFLSALEIFCALADTLLCIGNLLVAELNLERLELNLLAQHVVLTVVAHFVQLLLVAVNAGLSFNNLTLLLRDGTLELVNLVLDAFNTGGQTFDFCVKVFYLQGQFTAQCLLLVNRREGGLKLEQIFQLLLY